MRSFDEMARSALAVRCAMLNKEQDTKHGRFFVTSDELMVLRAQPPFNHLLMDPPRTRLCGLKLMVIET